MLDCRSMNFSPKLARCRLAAAQAVFGEAMLRRILAFTLFIFGVKRSEITETLGMPAGTVRSLVRRVLNIGLDGFVDHRRKAVAEVPVAPVEPSPLTVRLSGSDQVFTVGGGELTLSPENPIQMRVILLSLIGKDMLSVQEAAQVLELSPSHVRRLHRQLLIGDVDAIIDKRRGQQQDYVVDAGLKGRMIAAFVLELAERGRVSSAVVARRLEALGDKVAERTVRHHLSGMGLNEVRGVFATALSTVKKSS